METLVRISKKEFKKQSDAHVFTGWNGKRIKHNVIYFDYQQGDGFKGFKYVVAMDIKEGTKAELEKHLYDWVNNEIEPPYNVRYKFAATDANRFRPQLTLTF